MNAGLTESGPVAAVPKREVYGFIGKWVAGIPEARIRRFGRLLGSLIYRIDVPHRRIVRRNLGFAYPDWPRERIRRCSREIFENIGAAFVEIFQFRYLSREEIIRRVRIDGRDNLAAAQAGPSGFILVSAHFGNWELAPLFGSCVFCQPMALVARTIRPHLLDRWVTGLRTRFGNRIIDKKGGLAQMTRSLRRGYPLGMLIDQGTKRSEGIKTVFFGRTVSATPAAAMLALRCRCPVYPAFAVRRKEGGFVIKILPEMKMRRSGDLRSDLQANTEKMMAVIEKMVRAYPEQWFWVEKRWKHYYPDLYPEYQARRRRRRLRRFKRSGDVEATKRRLPRERVAAMPWRRHFDIRGGKPPDGQ
jgi:KDO2-lipid IV(A) lauroyltransferase